MPVHPSPFAEMGFPGFVQFDVPASQSLFTNRNIFQVRANSCNLNLSQDIDRPLQAKSPGYPFSYPYQDRVVYTIKPEVIEGSISFPVVMSDVLCDQDGIMDLWNLAIQRTTQERLRPFDINIKYTASQQAYKFSKCYLNSFKFSVAQGGPINVNVDVYGSKRDKQLDNIHRKPATNSRIATWADAVVELEGPWGTVDGKFVRDFNASVSNGCERFYAAGGTGFKVRDITPKLRDIDGSIKVIGKQLECATLADYAKNNPSNCSSRSSLVFGYDILCSSTPQGCQHTNREFRITLPNIVVTPEEVQLTNEIFETEFKWYCLPSNIPLGIVSDYQTSLSL